MITPLESKFWKHVSKKDQDECWSWLGGIRDGYGIFSANGKSVSAHRFSWELVNGLIPNGLCVCHACDVRHCVNPNHLFLGTKKDNMHDASKKGRLMHGENHKDSFLTKEQVIEIYKSQKPIRELEDLYLVAYKTIWQIKNGTRWTWITDYLD